MKKDFWRAYITNSDQRRKTNRHLEPFIFHMPVFQISSQRHHQLEDLVREQWQIVCNWIQCFRVSSSKSISFSAFFFRDERVSFIMWHAHVLDNEKHILKKCCFCLFSPRFVFLYVSDIKQMFHLKFCPLK